MMNNNVSAIIVTYNPQLEKLECLINSVVNQVGQLLIIDNSSENVEYIQSRLNGRGQLVCLETNIGIAAAQNIGINLAIENQSSHVLLLDQDTALPKDFVNSLLLEEKELLEKNIPVGALGPIFYDKRTLRQYPLALIDGFSLKKVYVDENQSPMTVSFIIASGSLIRTDVILNVGNMMEELFIDYVDIEWCLRAISKGYNIFVSSKTKILHEIGDERTRIINKDFSVHSPIRNYYISRNGFILCLLKHVPIKYKLRILTYTNIRNIAHAFIGGKRVKNFSYTILGIMHGVVGVKGKIK